MKFDGTVTLGNIITVGSLVLLLGPLYFRLLKFMALIDNFPLHRHEGEDILFPKGMDPKNGK